MQPLEVAQGGRALIGLGPTPRYQTLSNSEYPVCNQGSEAAGDKIRRREGNNPDYRLRSQSHSLVENDVELLKQPGGWLRSSHPLKKA